jgi:hypothetical protein
METFNYRENVWLIKMAQIFPMRFKAVPETEEHGYQASFVGTCEELKELLAKLN